jgi:hypothetical protein
MKPTIGRTVLYVLSEDDCRLINLRINNQGLRGNTVSPGQILPLVICRVWDEKLYGMESINGQVLLDGEGSHWRTSCHPDPDKAPGTWHWPEVVKPGGDSISRMDAELSLDQTVILTQLELRVRQLCAHIETLGASSELTGASVQASNARQVLAALVLKEPMPPYIKDWLEGAN